MGVKGCAIFENWRMRLTALLLFQLQTVAEPLFLLFFLIVETYPNDSHAT